MARPEKITAGESGGRGERRVKRLQVRLMASPTARKKGKALLFYTPSPAASRRHSLALLAGFLLSALHPVARAQNPIPPLYGNVVHVDVKGNTHASTFDIIQKLIGKNGTSMINVGKADAASLNVDAVKAMGLFQSVDVTTDRDPLGGTDVTCTVVENPIVKAIKFTANTPDGKPTVPETTLLAHMHLVMGQVLNTNTLSSDLEALCDHDTGYLRSLGYLCDYSHDTATDPDTGVLTITLVEGFIDKVKVRGNGPVSAADVLSVLQIKPGDLINLNALHAGLDRIEKKHWFIEMEQWQFISSETGKFTLTVTVRVPRATAGTLAGGSEKPVTVSYGGMVGGPVIVPVRVNDHVMGHFVLMTDADLSEISSTFAASLGVTAQPMLVDGQPYFLNGQPANSMSLQLTLGGTDGIGLRDVSLPINDLSKTSKQYGQTIDGIIGADILSQVAVGIDFPRRQITFWNHGHLSVVERKAAGFAEAFEVPLEHFDAGSSTPGVTMQLKNGSAARALPFFIATSNPIGSLPAAEAKALGMTPLPNSDDHPSALYRPSSLDCGGLTLNAPLFQLTETDDDTTLGMNVLQRYRVLLDGPAHTACFAPEVVVSGADPHRTSFAVPFRFDYLTVPLPVVRASINGHAPMSFILDTGWSSAITLDRRAARTLGLPIDAGIAGKANGSVEFGTVPISTIVLQGRIAPDDVMISLEQAEVADLSSIHDAIPGANIAGVIGAGVMDDAAVRFDTSAHLATFYLHPDDVPVPSGTVNLPLSEGVSQNNYFATLSEPGGPSVKLLVDTGSEGTELPLSLIQTLKPKAAAVNGSWMLGSMMLGQNVLLSRLPLAGMPEGRLVVSAFPTNYTPSHWSPGTLGMSLLSHLTMTLDIAHMRLLLGPPSAKMPWPHGGWVGVRLAQKTGEFRITRVISDSPAAHAGLKTGDVLTTIDGRPLAGLSLFNTRNLVDGLAGTPATFVFRRGNAPLRTVRFRRADRDGDPPSPLNGVYGRREAANPFVVEAVVPGCPAARAGLAAVDTLSKINGLATQSLTTEQWQTIFLETRLTLVVTRAGRSRTVILVNAPSDLRNSHPPTGKITASGQEK